MTNTFVCTEVHMSSTNDLPKAKVLELVYDSAYIIFIPHVF